MVTDAMDQEQSGSRSGRNRLVRSGQITYQHLSAIFGTIGLAAIVSHFGVDWRGAVEAIVSFWDRTVRPPVAWIFHVLVEVPLGWFGWHVEVPFVVRDYLSVGVIYALSWIRVSVFSRRDLSADLGLNAWLQPYPKVFRGPSEDVKGGRRSNSFSVGVRVVLLWPVVILVSLASAYIFRTQSNPAQSVTYTRIPAGEPRPPVREQTAEERQRVWDELTRVGEVLRHSYRRRLFPLSISPLIYVGILLLLNYFAFR